MPFLKWVQKDKLCKFSHVAGQPEIMITCYPDEAGGPTISVTLLKCFKMREIRPTRAEAS